LPFLAIAVEPHEKASGCKLPTKLFAVKTTAILSSIQDSAQSKPTPFIGVVWARGQVGQKPQTSGISCQCPNFALKPIKPEKINSFSS